MERGGAGKREYLGFLASIIKIYGEISPAEGQSIGPKRRSGARAWENARGRLGKVKEDARCPKRRISVERIVRGDEDLDELNFFFSLFYDAHRHGVWG